MPGRRPRPLSAGTLHACPSPSSGRPSPACTTRGLRPAPPAGPGAADQWAPGRREAGPCREAPTRSTQMGRSRGALPGVRSLLRKHPDEVPTLPPPAQRGLSTWEGGSGQQKSRSLEAGRPRQAGGATGECPHVARIQGPEEPPHPLPTRPAGCQARSGEQIQGTQTVQPHSDPRPRTCTHWTVGDQLPTPQKARKAGNPQRQGQEEGGGPQREDTFPT